MGRRKKVTTKECAMTGMTFPTTEFYANSKSADGLHLYSKKADNFRRRLQATGATVGTTELRTMFNNLFQTTV
tara:strand:- start:23 stop:241 length:219 start_codon:yes stop_codon:yes gene_type:complete